MTLQFICVVSKGCTFKIVGGRKRSLRFNGPALVLRRRPVAVADAGFCGRAVHSARQIGWRTAHRAILHEQLRCDSLTQ